MTPEDLKNWRAAAERGGSWSGDETLQLLETIATLTAERDKLYQELHRFDPDREQAGDWLPLSLREAVASLSPEQRVVVCDWYWRTSLIFKTHQTQISALEAERDALRTALEDVQAIQAEYDGKPYMIPVAGWAAIRERLQHGDVREALGGKS